MTPYYGPHNGITIYHGDCREILPLIDSVDHVIADPPYTQRTSENCRSGEDGTYDGTRERRIDFDGVDGREAAIAMLLLSKAQRWVIVFCALEQLGAYSAGAGDSWIRSSVWHRTNSAPQFTGDRPGQSCEGLAVMHRPGKKRWNRGGVSLFYEGPTINAVSDRDRGTKHPTTKPEWLMRSVVNDFTDAGNTILDPFMGSGTTLVAAKRLGRIGIGIELEEKYCEIAAKRLAQEALPLEMIS